MEPETFRLKNVKREPRVNASYRLRAMKAQWIMYRNPLGLIDSLADPELGNEPLYDKYRETAQQSCWLWCRADLAV